MGQRYQLPDGRVVEQLPGGGYQVVSGGSPMNNPLVDPRLAPQVQKAQNEAAASVSDPATAQANLRIKELEAKIAEAQANVAGAKTQADLDIARANLAKTQAEIAQLQSGKNGALNALQGQVDRVGELYRQNVQGGMPNIINDVIPDFLQPSKGKFDTAAQGLSNPFMAAFRIPGVGAQSDTELRQFLASNVPSQGDTDAEIEEKLANIQRRIDAERGQLGQQPTQPAAGPDVTLNGGQDTRSQIDPALQAVGQRVGAMLAQGVPDGKIRKFLLDSGVPPASTNIDGALNFRRTNDFRRWQQLNPGAAYPIGPEFYTKQVRVSGARKLFNKTAATGPGGALAAGMAASANAISGGRLDDAVGALSGDPAMAQTGMQLLRTAHPNASLAGDLAGQATVEAAAGLIPGAKALMATRWGRRGADALYGAYSGSGEGDNPIMGAITGAVANAGGGALFRSGQRGLGRTLTGVRNANLGYLNSQGIPLTIGQIGRGSDNVFGHAIGGLEDRAAGVPVFDAIVNSARGRGEEGFNQAAFRQAGGSGLTGARGVSELSDNVTNAYSFLDPVNLPLDAQFAGGQAAVRSTLPGLPKYGPEIDAGLNLIDKASAGGRLSGRDWQQSLRTVKSDRASLKGKEFSQGAVDTLGDVENNLLDFAARQSPANLQGDLASANALNKQFHTIEGALDNAGAQKRGQLFSPTQLDTAARVSARKFGGRTASLTGNRPFYQLTQAGMDVMPNEVPDSGTAGRALLYSTLFGGGVGGTLGAAFNSDDRMDGAADGGKLGVLAPLAIASLYSKPGQKALQKALLGQRPDKMIKLGEFLIRNPKYMGMFGSAIGRDYVLQPELP